MTEPSDAKRARIIEQAGPDVLALLDHLAERVADGELTEAEAQRQIELFILRRMSANDAGGDSE